MYATRRGKVVSRVSLRRVFFLDTAQSIMPTGKSTAYRVSPADAPQPQAAVTVKKAASAQAPSKPFLITCLNKKQIRRTLFNSPVGALLLVCTFTFTWCIVEIFAPPPYGINTGWSGGIACIGTDSTPMPICICPHEAVCVKNWQSLIFLAFARLSAYFDYPLYVLLFLSKAHNLRGALQRTYLPTYLPCSLRWKVSSVSTSISGSVATETVILQGPTIKHFSALG